MPQHEERERNFCGGKNELQTLNYYTIESVKLLRRMHFTYSALRRLQIKELFCLCIKIWYTRLKWLFAKCVHLCIKNKHMKGKQNQPLPLKIKTLISRSYLSMFHDPLKSHAGEFRGGSRLYTLKFDFSAGTIIRPLVPDNTADGLLHATW